MGPSKDQSIHWPRGQQADSLPLSNILVPSNFECFLSNSGGDTIKISFMYKFAIIFVRFFLLLLISKKLNITTKIALIFYFNNWIICLAVTCIIYISVCFWWSTITNAWKKLFLKRKMTCFWQMAGLVWHFSVYLFNTYFWYVIFKYCSVYLFNTYFWYVIFKYCSVYLFNTYFWYVIFKYCSVYLFNMYFWYVIFKYCSVYLFNTYFWYVIFKYCSVYLFNTYFWYVIFKYCSVYLFNTYFWYVIFKYCSVYLFNTYFWYVIFKYCSVYLFNTYFWYVIFKYC